MHAGKIDAFAQFRQILRPIRLPLRQAPAVADIIAADDDDARPGARRQQARQRTHEDVEAAIGPGCARRR
jgi:hypothetical protein